MHTADVDGLHLRVCAEPGLYAATAGARIALPHKSLVLLAYLTMETGAHTRAHLSTMLWADSDEAHAAMSLRQALSKLRDAVGDAVFADRANVQITATALRCDALEFVSALEQSTLPSAMVPVHQAFDGLSIDGAPGFGHWADRTRARLVRRATAALQRCTVEWGARRDWAQVLRAAEQWLEFAPVNVDAACTAIEAAFMRRDASRAIEIRDAFLGRLNIDGSIDGNVMERVRAVERRYDAAGWRTPMNGAATVTALSSNDKGDGTGRASGNEDGAALVASRTPFATTLRERDAAWREIRTAIDRVTESETPEMFVLTGGVGSGRTRLLEEVAAYAKVRQATVLSTRDQRQASSAPFSAIATLVRDMLDVPGLSGVDESQLKVLQGLVPEVAQRFPQLRRMSTPDASLDATFAVRMQEVLGQVFVSIAEDSTLVLALDDQLWYDRESSALLLALMQRPERLPLLWIMTAADDQTVQSGNPAWAEASQRGVRLVLPALPVDTIAEMCAEFSGVGDGWVPLAERVHAATHGLPGFVVASLEALRASHDDDWRAVQMAIVQPPTLPLRQRQFIDALDDVERTVLLSLALMAEPGHPISEHGWREIPPLTLDVLSHVNGISKLRAAVVGQRMAAACLAHEVSSGFRCASPVVAEHLLTTGSTLLRNEVRALLHTFLPTAAP